MAVMDPELSALLLKEGVHADSIAFLTTAGIVTMGTFGDWVDEIKQITDAVAQMKSKDVPGEAPRLKACFRKVQAIQARRIKREADGLNPGELDEPLAPEVYRDVLATACTYYRWRRFHLSDIAADGTFAKWRREFQAWQPSQYAIAKVKSAAETRKQADHKRKRLTEGVDLWFHEMEEELASGCLDLWSWSTKLDITTTTWGIVGCFDVEAEDAVTKAKTTVKYVHMQEAVDFGKAFKSKIPTLRIKYSDDSVLTYVNDMFETFLAKAVEEARCVEKVTFGAALTHVLQTEAAIWLQRDALIHRNSGSRGHVQERASEAYASRKGGKSATERQDQGRAQPHRTPPKPIGMAALVGKKNIKTETKDKEGRSICKPYNDTRGCRNGAKCRASHACDVLLRSVVCGSKSHSRMNHDSAMHGAFEKR